MGCIIYVDEVSGMVYMNGIWYIGKISVYILHVQ